MAGLERSKHLPNAARSGWRGEQSRASTGAGLQSRQPRLARRPVQGRHGVACTQALRIGLRGDLKTPYMRRDEHHATSLRQGGVHLFRTLPANRHRPAQPQAWHFQSEATSGCHRGAPLRPRNAGLLCVGREVAPVTRRQAKHQPPQCRTQAMKQPQRQSGKQLKGKQHGYSKIGAVAEL